MSINIYMVEIYEPGKEPVSIMAKMPAAMRLVRRLTNYGIKHSYRRMEHSLLTGIEVEEIIDTLDAKHVGFAERMLVTHGT